MFPLIYDVIAQSLALATCLPGETAESGRPTSFDERLFDCKGLE